MKLYKIHILALAMSVGLVSCNDYLKQDPPSYLTPESFYTTESQVQAVANQFYQDVLPGHGAWNYGTYTNDNNTDNQTSWSPDNKFGTGLYKTSNTNGDWSWSNIRNINYQLNQILTKYKAGGISGSDVNIRQYIGEIYFMRAYCYFDLLKKFGDLPIITAPLADDEAILVAADKRQPCNEVARFIVSDLDSAVTYMKENFESKHTRVSTDAALLFKSRVALFEGSWLTNFAGTPFVPQGTGWPGATKDYNKNYAYPSGSIDKEAQYFFKLAADASGQVAEKYKNQLVTNTGKIPQSLSDANNPYFNIWGTTDCSSTPEVLLWRQYSTSLSVNNDVEVAVQAGDIGTGFTRSLIEGYLMKDGKPIYASDYQYSDTSLTKVATDRDPRLTIFLKVPGQINCFKNMSSSEDHYVQVEPVPNIKSKTSETGYVTGYTIRKGGTFDRLLCGNGKSYNACEIFRATEALLNYMEAEYMLTNDLSSGRTLEYWKIVREKAGFSGAAIDPTVTIQATNMSKETQDWGAYTAGQLLTDKVLYNIRRERRSELIAEGLRGMDLERWRSYDQLMTTPCHVEGFHLWKTPMQGWYTGLKGDGSSSSNVSSSSLSEYYRPLEVVMANNNFKDGLTWHMAHYLEPLPIRQFLLTASDHASIDQSPLYQNPYWPTTTDQPAEK
jgi:SusD family.